MLCIDRVAFAHVEDCPVGNVIYIPVRKHTSRPEVGGIAYVA